MTPYDRLTGSPWFVSIAVGFAAGLVVAGLAIGLALLVR